MGSVLLMTSEEEALEMKVGTHLLIGNDERREAQSLQELSHRELLPPAMWDF
jgi:hypothetical protein